MSSNNKTPTLEQRSVAALSDNTAEARHLADLITETERAIVDADARDLEIDGGLSVRCSAHAPRAAR